MTSDQAKADGRNDLWAGIDRKFVTAQFCLEEASRSVQPRERTATSVYLEAGGAIMGDRWQISLYAHVDSFLCHTSAVSEIINFCFGWDKGTPPKVKRWLNDLSLGEQQRRKQFSAQFKHKRDNFREHYLTDMRGVAAHRRGFPTVEGMIAGPFGGSHPASPILDVPAAEAPPIPDTSAVPAALWTGTHPAVRIQPKADQFTIEEKPLFDELNAYLLLARKLRDDASAIFQSVHGVQQITVPRV